MTHLPVDVLCAGTVLSTLYFRSERKDSTITVNHPSYLKSMTDGRLATPLFKLMISHMFFVDTAFPNGTARGGYQQFLQRDPRIWTGYGVRPVAVTALAGHAGNPPTT
jgi:hypothetical protein